MIRRCSVWIHRWTGLLMAAFLIVEGLTGSILAFYDSFERLVTPQFYAKRRPGERPLELAALAESAAALVPQGQVSFVILAGDRAIVYYRPRQNQATGKPYELGFTQFFVDPWTGKELGRRRLGEVSEGMVNLMPFIYILHTNLALGGKGSLLLGIVSLCWTIDCFVGFYLTLPVSLARFWRRWKPSWLVKWRSSAFRVNFDLHRASGLWLWPMLLVFAWSSVMFNLPSVYKAGMHRLLDYTPQESVPLAPIAPTAKPTLDWSAAQAAGEKLMAQQAERRRFRVVSPKALFYSQETGRYTYEVQSTRDLSGAFHPRTEVTFDGNTGTFISLNLPNLERTGDQADAWLFALHRADVLGTPYRALVCAIGPVIVMLSITGIYIWWKKRKARTRAAAQRGPSPGGRRDSPGESRAPTTFIDPSCCSE